MAAVAVEMAGGTQDQATTAMAISLKNMLGLVCDPVAGLVEVPCVKRNAKRSKCDDLSRFSISWCNEYNSM